MKFFRRKRAPKSISKVILESRSQRIEKLCIDLWIKDQILFQVMPCSEMGEYLSSVGSSHDLGILHFFNKNKTHTTDSWEYFKDNYERLGLIFVEKPNNYHFFSKNIGSDPKNIELEIHRSIDLYERLNRDEITIRYHVY
ncbi:MAG: hypothetical protein AB8B56_04325 [Crocinitomicaceae bacterium]